MDSILLERVYKETKEALNAIYKGRKKALFLQKVMWSITGLFFVLILINIAFGYLPNSNNSIVSFFKQFQATPDNPYATIYPIIGLVVLLYPTTYLFANSFQKFKEKEAATISKMVKRLFPKVEFTQQLAAPKKEITKSKLFAWANKGTATYSYGQIRGQSNDKTVNIADIGIVEENVSNNLINTLMQIPLLNMFVILYQYVLKNTLTNKTADNAYFTYRGMFCWLSFKKSLQGHTVILTNNQSSKLNRFFSASFKEEQKVVLEDPRFTNEFIVYSTDQVEARYVLSTALMERIVKLKETFNQPILLSFQNKEMYLAVKSEHGLFSFPSGKIDNIKMVAELAHNISTALAISDELKLN